MGDPLLPRKPPSVFIRKDEAKKHNQKMTASPPASIENNCFVHSWSSEHSRDALEAMPVMRTGREKRDKSHQHSPQGAKPLMRTGCLVSTCPCPAGVKQAQSSLTGLEGKIGRNSQFYFSNRLWSTKDADRKENKEKMPSPPVLCCLGMRTGPKGVVLTLGLRRPEEEALPPSSCPSSLLTQEAVSVFLKEDKMKPHSQMMTESPPVSMENNYFAHSVSGEHFLDALEADASDENAQEMETKRS